MALSFIYKSFPITTNEEFILNEVIEIAHSKKEKFIKDNVLLFVSSFKEQKDNKLFESADWVIAFDGDLLEPDRINFNSIILDLSGKTKYFDQLNGVFAIIAFNKLLKKVTIITDFRSQKPIFYFVDKDIIISTKLPVFIKLLRNFNFNLQWFYQYLFFNYPVGQTSFLSNVKRAKPFSVTEIDLDHRVVSIRKYSEQLKKRNPLLKNIEAIEYASEVFLKRIPLHAITSGKIISALSGGWDSFLILAHLLNNKDNLITYTYGGKYSSDVLSATNLTKKLNVKHKLIYFDHEFLKLLPNLLLETVATSFGIQGIQRATLLHVYRKLFNETEGINSIISGIALDRLFRGHASMPSFISPYMGYILTNGFNSDQLKIFKNVVHNFDEFVHCIEQSLSYLQEQFGDFKDSMFHFLFDFYEVQPNYFAGEIELVNNFFCIKIPAYDKKIIELALSIEYSTLMLSQFAGYSKKVRDEFYLYAKVIEINFPKLLNMAVGNSTPKAIITADLAFFVERKIISLKNKINSFNAKKDEKMLEDWDRWLNMIMSSEKWAFNKENNFSTTIFYNNNFISKCIDSKDFYKVKKLLNIEIIYNLLNNNWSTKDLKQKAIRF